MRGNRLSITGALANEDSAGAPFSPGTAPETNVVNFNKGLIVAIPPFCPRHW